MAYHHGQLADALLSAAVDLARIGGPDAVVLRAASRAAGVSHNAVYRHYADRDALLRAVCGQCMSRLALLMERRVGEVDRSLDQVPEAWARLLATGRAYVEFALSEPGWFRTAFAVPPGMGYLAAGEGLGTSGLDPYAMLGDALDVLVEVGAIPAERRPGAEFAAWSAVHGLSTLLIDGPLRDLPVEGREVALAKVLALVAEGL